MENGLGPFTNDISCEGERGHWLNSDQKEEVA